MKPYEKDGELAQLKKDVANLERGITIKIQKNQLANKKSQVTKEDKKEAPVVKIEKSLLPKKELSNTKVKGMRI